MRKRSILVFLQHYLPGSLSGGPVRSIANMIEHLGDNIEFKVVCLDRDLRQLVAYPDVQVGAWQRVGKGDVIYLPAQAMRPWHLRKLLGTRMADTVYFNSFFNPRFTILPLWSASYGLLPAWNTLIAPRGEFSPGALKFSAQKKKAYLCAAKASGVLKDVQWHASTDYEAEDIKRVTGVADKRITIAPDLPGGVPDDVRPCVAKAPGTLRVVALSRVVRQKNLARAIEIVSRLQGDIVFDIYGLVEDRGYLEECEALIGVAPRNVKINFLGPVAHEAVIARMDRYDVFLLPTNSENFGHSIYEAMSCGLPVVISDRTPWRNLQEHGAGHDLDLDDAQAFVTVLSRYVRMSAVEFEAHRDGARRFAQDWLHASGAMELNRRLFTELSLATAGKTVGQPA